ncbi:MAG: homoserine O-acetyltransferase [Actinomycetota bacterium]|nr:homoserine O-acetyltransferase [Actinomycetota bacterium]
MDRKEAILFNDSPFITEGLVSLGNVKVAYETWGELNSARNNAVLVLHALTGDSHAASHHEGDSFGWWEGLIGPSKAIDTSKFFVIAPNVFGSCYGTTGPTSIRGNGAVFGADFPEITIGDQVSVEKALIDHLGIDHLALVIGGSMGGMRALEWGYRFGYMVDELALVATCARATAFQIGLSSLQIRSIELDPNYRGGRYYEYGVAPEAGLSLARGVAHLSYRNSSELDDRFSNKPSLQREGSSEQMYEVDSYLRHHGDKLNQRFDANTYIKLVRAMSNFDIGRGRGGVEAALSKITSRTIVIGVDGDELFHPHLQYELALGIGKNATMDLIKSDVGHDGFLVDAAAIGEVLLRRSSVLKLDSQVKEAFLSCVN